MKRKSVVFPFGYVCLIAALSFSWAFFVATLGGQRVNFMLWTIEAYCAVENTAIRFTKIIRPDPFDEPLLRKELARLSPDPDPTERPSHARF